VYNNRKNPRMMKKHLFTFPILILFLFTLQVKVYAQTGKWTAVKNLAPHFHNGGLTLLTDGRVLCHNTNGGGLGTGWDVLTPDSSGSYINGRWDSIAPMEYDRLYFSSQVLPNGNVYVAGGEYGAGGGYGEVYNPLTNIWTPCGPLPSGWIISDGNSQILYNGNVLEGPQEGTDPSYDCLFYNPTTNLYTTAPSSLYNHDEAAWLKLPDSSILFVGIASDNSNRYIPQTNTWVNDGTVLGNLYDPSGEEAGGSFMLPNGKAVFFGATNYNAIYTPSGNSNPGTWSSASSFPMINGYYVGQPDASSAMMVNGHILCAVSPINSPGGEFSSPCYFLEYDYTTNTFTQVKAVIPGFGGDSLPVASYQTNMIDLPDGNVLVSNFQQNFSNQYYIYTPGSAAIPQGKPTINNILVSNCNNYSITGKLFNGISEGASYGDDWQMETNYPIVRLTNGTKVYYARTTNWNRVGAVQTDSLEDTVQFALPSMPGGTYSLVVVANGFASNPVLFTTFGAAITAQTNISCGHTIGSATVSASNGVTPYTYSWAPGGGTKASASNLSAGTYTVTVTGHNGCSVTVPVSITAPYSLNVSVYTTANTNCNGNTGSAASTVSGGSLPYTYSWSPSGGNTDTAVGLSVGTYTLTVTDNCGSTGTSSCIVPPPNSVVDSAYETATTSCNGNTGSAASTIYGGTPPYTYSWAPSGGSTDTAVGLSVGTYTLTVIDNCGSTAITVVNITPPYALNVNAYTITNAECVGGSAAASIYGGTSPYTYSWSPSGGSSDTAIGLSVGGYTLTVTDNCGSIGSSYIYIYQNTVSVNPYVLTNASCNGGGSATANVYGGTQPYTYSWVPSGESTATATGLSAGYYTVTVTDSCGSVGSGYIYINQNTISINPYALTNANCNGGGSAIANVYGGTPPYTYSWSPSGGSSDTATGLSVGYYTVTVTDSCGSIVSGYVYIYQNALSVNPYALTTASCKLGGSATANVSGGMPPYTYSWSLLGGSGDTATGLSVGYYTVTVTDSCGSIVSGYVDIYQDAVSAYAYTLTYVPCNGGNVGSATVSVNGGTLPYTYSWSPSGGNSATATGLSAGNYTVTITDNCGSSATASVTTFQSSVYVNAYTLTSVPCNGGNTGSAEADAYNGISPYTYAWTPTGGNAYIANGLSAGNYTVTVTDICGSSATASVTTFQNPVYAYAYTNTNVLCNGGNAGSAEVNVYNGTYPYTYSWSPSGGNAYIANGLTAGTYTITVTDNCGSWTTSTATITQPVAISVTDYLINDNGSHNGVAAVTPSGGTAPYTYLWSYRNKTTDTIKGLSAGNYSYVVTDNNHCEVTNFITVKLTTGIENVSSAIGQITIYPNPNNGKFAIQSSVEKDGVIVEIYDVLGEVIYSGSLNLASGGSSEINIGSQSSGVYFYRILKEDGDLLGEGKVVIVK